MNNAIQLALAFVYGSMLGSFLCVIYSRYPDIKGQGINKFIYGLSYPPSACPKCNHRIQWYENVPLISYILLHGKCSDCKSIIPINYFIFEIVSGVVSFIGWWLFVL